MKPLLIDLTKVLDQVGEEMAVACEIPLESVSLGEELVEFPRPFQGDFRLRNTGQGILVSGHAEGMLKLTCSRCLNRFDLPLKLVIEEVAAVEPEADDVFPISGGKLDIAAVVYQNAITEIPMRSLCRAECAGLCSVCGKNLNEEPHEHAEDKVDERLAVLRKFLEK